MAPASAAVAVAAAVAVVVVVDAAVEVVSVRFHSGMRSARVQVKQRRAEDVAVVLVVAAVDAVVMRRL